MDKYLVSFRIGDAGDYDERYNDLTFDLSTTIPGNYWDETTSFYVKETNLTLEDLFDRLIGHLDRRYDVLLILGAEHMVGYVGGAYSDQDIFALLPFVKKR